MTLSVSEKTSVLRHLGYGVVGLFQTSPAGGSLAYGNLGYRYFGVESALLYRLGQLAPNEESRLMGRAYGAVGFTGFGPAAGDQVTVSLFNGPFTTPLTKVTTAAPTGPLGSPYTLLNFAASIAQSFAMDQTFQSLGMLAIADYGSQPFSASRVQIPICSFVAPPGQSGFNIATSFAGTTAPQILNQGELPGPYLSLRQQGQINKVFGYVPILDYLESGWLGSSGSMSLNAADNVKFRHDENEQRRELYESYRCKLAEWLKVPLGDDAQGHNGVQVHV